MKPTFSEEEVNRVARRLGMERQQFIESYIERSEANGENRCQTRATPCPFLKTRDIPEIITHLIFYSGRANAMSG